MGSSYSRHDYAAAAAPQSVAMRQSVGLPHPGVIDEKEERPKVEKKTSNKSVRFSYPSSHPDEKPKVEKKKSNKPVRFRYPSSHPDNINQNNHRDSSDSDDSSYDRSFYA